MAALEWQRVGLVVPTIVRDASEAYFAEQDTLRQWIEDCLDEEPNAFTASRALFISWKAWSEARNMRSGTEKAFVEELVGRGYQQHRTSYARGLNGLALKAHDGPSTEGALV
jgi:putative DNA primase/helicase